MSAKFKQKVAKNMYDAVYNKFYLGQYNEFLGCFKLLKLDKHNKIFWRVGFPFHAETRPDKELLTNSQKELIETGKIKNVTYSDMFDKNTVELELETKQFIKDVIDSNPINLSFKSQPKKIIVEFSSPNIAKPFYVGHLRSIMIGNCLANIKKKLGNDIVKMNYLGDWGTQFGMIQVGLKLENYSEDELKKDPIKLLFNAYVRGNREAARQEEVYDEAKKIFAQLESGDKEILQIWQKYRNWTLDELNNTYQRIGVSFDECNWESDYKRKEADKVLKLLEEKGILSEDEKGRKIFTIEDNEIPLVKSDDTTLYLLRDLMAIIDRKSRHKFDEMYYVVENGQSLHFDTLFKLSKEINLNEETKLQHVKFGRIHFISTRKGKVIFINDIFEEAQERCYERQLNSKYTRVPESDTDTSDILGVSGVVVNDLKMKRQNDYVFDWEKILQIKGETGIHLQYCYCRLFSLEANSGATAASECDPDALLEPEAINLVVEIAKFEEALLISDYKLEPCVLVKYLFQLVKAINIAFKVLTVKNSEEHLGSQRLLMFNKSRDVLGEGLKLLGLRLLTKM